MRTVGCWLWAVGCRLLTLVFVLTVCYSELTGQGVTRQVNHQSQFWTSINTTVRASRHFGVMGDFHIRTNNFISDPSFYFLRFGGVYFFDSRFSAAAGYAHLWLAKKVGNEFKFENENRIYQQVLWRARIGRTTFLQRIRNEQRWSEVLDENGGVDRIRFTNRLRFLFSFAFQLFDNPKLPRPVISDEVHIHFGDEVVFNTFNQNRIFIGISQRITPNLSFDFGYMNVYQQKFSGYEYDMNHTLRLFFYYSPDFRKRKDEEYPHYPLPGEE